MPQTNICKITGQKFEITDKEIEQCQAMGVPLPNLAPLERLRKLMAFRNEWKLYRRKCDASGEEILSAYAPDSPFKVYKNKIWWGDTWNALAYGQDFDFTKPFFAQYAELQKAVPHEGTSIFNSENCDYNSHIRESKNCYLNSLVFRCEDLYYSYWMVNDINVYDSLLTNDSTLCYHCSNVNHSYHCSFLEESTNCHDCYFCYQLRGCNHCLFSSNLANKSYYAFNKPCSKEEFEEIKNSYVNGSHASLEKAKAEFTKVWQTAKHHDLHNLNCENVSGDHLYNCRNCQNTYEGFNSEDCVNSISLGDATKVHSCYSAGWPDCPGPVYFSLVSRACQDVAFGNYNWFCSKLRYCEGLNACNNCFGCIGLRHRNYCILNKQYSKETYEKLLPKIIEHMQKEWPATRSHERSEGVEWGQFFPNSLSSFAYNETAAQDFFPLTKDAALALGYKWRNEDIKEFKEASLTEIPDNSQEITDDFLKEVLACARCQKNYKIIEPELRFYRQENLPIPRICPQCRHQERSHKRNPFILFARTCSNCGKKITSTYNPEREESVYCEECFLQSIV